MHRAFCSAKHRQKERGKERKNQTMYCLREKGGIRQTKTLQEWGLQIPLIEKLGFDMIGYNFVFETKDEYCAVGVFYACEPIGLSRIRKELRKYVSADLYELKPEDVFNCVLIASDGDCIEMYDVNPSAIWPLSKTRKKYSNLFNDGGEN